MQDAQTVNNDQNATQTNEADVFSREYVEELRRENAKYRTERNSATTQLSELEKKASEYEQFLRKQQEEQGKYKELYESTVKQVENLKRYESRVNSLESVFVSQLDELKKVMDEGKIKLIDELPSEMTVEQKLKWAKELVGSKNIANTSGDLRSGGEPAQTADSIMKEFSVADTKKRMEILFAVEKTNPTLYNALVQLRK